MATPIGTGPNGGVLMQDDNGQHYEVQGNNVVPVPPPVDADQGGTGYGGQSSAPTNSGSGSSGGRGPTDAELLDFDHQGGTGSSPEAGPMSVQPPDNSSIGGRSNGVKPIDPDEPADPIDAPVVDKYGPSSQPAPAAAPQTSGSGGGAQPAPHEFTTDDFDAAVGDEQAAAKAGGKAKADAATRVGAFEDYTANEAKQRLDTFNANRQKQLAAGQQKLADENAEIEKIGSGKQTVDPEHFWKSRTLGQRIAGTIALGLGGFAAGIGGADTGGKMISDAIERDNAAQRFNIEQNNANQKAKVAARGTAFEHFLSLTGNANAAEAAANAWGLDQARLKVEAMKSSLSSPVEIAAADQFIAQLGQKSAEYKQQAQGFNTTQKTAALQQQGMALDNEARRLQLQAQRAAAATAGQRLVDSRAVPNALHSRAIFLGNHAIIDEDEKKAEVKRDQVSALVRADKGIADLQAWLDQHPVTSRMWGEDNKIAKQRAIAIASDFQQASGLKNTLPAEQMAEVEHVITAGPTAGPGAIKGALDGLRGRFRGAVSGEFAAGGLPDPVPLLFGRQETAAQKAALAKAGR